ncbi:MAG: DUF6541 family protein [Chloroflexota bacterium]
MTGLFAMTVLCAGFGVLRLLGVARGAVAAGLAPAAGLAVLVILSSWSVLLGAPALIGTAAVYATALLGFIQAVRDREPLLLSLSAFVHTGRVPAALLSAALAIPFVAMGFAFAGAQVPLSPHDGASHTEAVQAFRTGHSWLAWYPPGLAALFGACLGAFPWLDSAQGAFELGLGLPALAALAVFGLSLSIWHELRVAAAGAVLLSLTYLYPYFPQLWSGWPLAMSLILVMGMWTVALAYLDRPSVRWGVLAGLVLGAILLVHGSEVYTLAIVLPLVCLGGLGRVVWRRLGWPILVAAGVAIVSASPYLPNLTTWAGAGGAYAAGLAAGATPQGATSAMNGQPSAFATFTLNALGIDLPVRVLLLAIGVAWSVRARVGRTVAAVGIVFGALAVALNGLPGVAPLREVYALTFPWGMHYRLLMLVAIAQALLAGAGGVALISAVNRRTAQPTAWARRIRRVTRILVVTWLGLTTLSLALFTAYPARQALGFTSEDASAMQWLREHAAPGEVLLNDGYADAGIWAPYKTGMPILLPRTLLVTPDEIARRTLVWQSAGQLADVAEAACAEQVSYMYSGSKASAWDERRFPPPELLRTAPALEEVFRQGSAVVFRIHLACR